MLPDTPFLSASVGKLVLAAAVLALIEDQQLAIDDPIGDWIEADVLAGLPVVGGDAAAARITVAQLLSHRSGLPDYFDGQPTRAGPRCSS